MQKIFKMKILIAEDDRPTAFALKEHLAAYRYTIDLATDGEMALDLASSFAYDLILLDVVMPKIDGISLCAPVTG